MYKNQSIASSYYTGNHILKLLIICVLCSAAVGRVRVELELIDFLTPTTRVHRNSSPT